MAPSDAFSTVANAFSVVGLADVVFKYGREVVETLVKIHNAPKQIEVLIGEIKYVEDHVARVRIFISDLAQSALAKTNQDVILVIEALLFRCQQEFIVIHKSAHDATISSANGWLTRFGKKAKWVWEEQDIALSCRRLGKMRTELDSALTLAGRRTDIEVYEEITKARADITQMSAKSSKELDDLGTTIEHEAEAVAQKIHALTRDTVVSLDGIRSVALDTQRVACSSAAGIEKKVEAAIKKSTKQNLALRNHYDAGNGALRRDLKAVSKEYTSSTKKMARKQNAATAKILAKLGEVHSDVATLSLTRSSRECFTFEGTNLESATLPLMLLHSELVNALPILKSEGKVQVSQSEASWVEDQFETVLAASHEASARAARARAAGGTAPGQLSRRQQNVNDPVFRHIQGSYTLRGPGRQQKLIHYTLRQQTPMGILTFIVSRSMGPSIPGNAELHSINISFCPSIPFGRSGICVTFAASQSQNRPSVLPSLRAWNTIPLDSPAFKAAATNDTQALRLLFETGAASPFDRTPDGYSLAAQAFSSRSCDIFELLLQQGAGISELESAYEQIWLPGHSSTEGGWMSLARLCSTLISRREDIFNYFDYTSIIIRLGQDLISLLEDSSANDCILSSMKSFLTLGAELEFSEIAKESYIYFPALLQLAYRRPHRISIRELYRSLDMNPEAILMHIGGSWAGKHLSFALFVFAKYICNVPTEFLISSLVELTELGSPVNLADIWQKTPTDYASAKTEFLCIWKAAVQKAGYELAEVHCSDGTTLAQLWQDFLAHPRRIPNTRALLKACELDQLGEVAEIFLEDSSLLREAWVEGLELDALILLDTADLRAGWHCS